MSHRFPALSRRAILGAAAASLGLPGQAFAQARLTPTPSCDDGDDPTPPQTAGPFFKPRSPQRASLIEPGMAGTRLTLSGTVMTRSCRPVPRVLIDLWQANAKGVYDNTGYRLRGHQFTDADGRFRFETVVPGSYDGRTRHLHLRAQAPNRRILTTQLYFPDEALNARDGLFNPALVMQTREAGGRVEATYNIVLAMR
ncbi:MAG: dioxygenase [Pseudomonadota bacterium]